MGGERKRGLDAEESTRASASGHGGCRPGGAAIPAVAPKPAARQRGLARRQTLRVRHAEHVMGTVVSFDVTAAFAGAALTEAVRWLHWVDATFSPFVPDSEVSRLARGEISVARCAPEVAEILAACDSVAEASGGYFSASYAGRLDPSGYVKGWAIERAAALLTSAGSRSHCVNGGGDVQCVGARSAGAVGEPATGSASDPAGEPWRIGIADPSRSAELIRVVTGYGFAVATSGVAERGPHIIDPHTGLPADEFLSMTVIGPRLALADAYATAAMAMGSAARDWIEGLDGYCGFAILANGTWWQTGGFAAYLALPKRDLKRSNVLRGTNVISCENAMNLL